MRRVVGDCRMCGGYIFDGIDHECERSRHLTAEEQKVMHEALRQSVTIVAKGNRK